jgi:hypothetical protein
LLLLPEKEALALLTHHQAHPRLLWPAPQVQQRQQQQWRLPLVLL